MHNSPLYCNNCDLASGHIQVRYLGEGMMRSDCPDCGASWVTYGWTPAVIVQPSEDERRG